MNTSSSIPAALLALLATILACGSGSAVAAGVPGQGSWETTLHARDLDNNAANGPEAFYDSALNITWLRAGSTSWRSWSDAKAWAEADRYGLSAWRLPTAQDTGAPGCDLSLTGGTDCGVNPDSSVATGSEMAHLFYQTLGNKGFYVPGTTTIQAGYGLTNTGDFQNLQNDLYWYGTAYAPEATSSAWRFGFNVGSQNRNAMSEHYYALAVHDGDVSAAVPEPQSAALLMLGLGGLLMARRRRTA